MAPASHPRRTVSPMPNYSLPLSALLSVCLLPAAGVAQAQVPGFCLAGSIFQNNLQLVDKQGNAVHTWTGRAGGLAYYVLEGGDLLRTYTPSAAPSGYPPGSQGGVERLGFDGALKWQYELFGPNQRLHHDLEPMPNGNVLMIAWDEMTPNEAVSIGRAPSQMQGTVFRPDSILEVQPTGPTTGAVVWEWHIADHVIQDADPNAANYGVVSSNPQLVDINYPPHNTDGDDWNHVNSVKYDPVNDWIIISSHRQEEVWVIDHSTTSAEAAGHTGGARGKGGDLLYRWGNPAAYQMGTQADQQLFGQHGPYFIPPGYPGAGNVLLFNNTTPTGSAIFELVMPLDSNGDFVMNAAGTFDPVGPVWSYYDVAINSSNVSNTERLVNGNTLICAGAAGHIREVDSAGNLVWEYTHPTAVFQTHHVERRLWADKSQVSVAAGGSVQFDLVNGTDHAGSLYWLLGSFSTGSSLVSNGFTLPLAVDPYLLLSIDVANSPLLSTTRGILDAEGRGVASLNLPATVLPPSLAGMELYHAFAVISPSGLITATSDAVRLQLLP